MNILTIIILAVVALCVYSGYKKGFLKTAFSLVSWILVLVLCEFATPIVTEMLVEYTDIEVVVQTTVEQKLTEIVGQAIENSGLSELENVLPSAVEDLVLGEEQSLSDLLLNSSTGLEIAPLIDGIMNIIGFVVTVIILRIAMIVVEFALGVVAKLPLIGPLDKVLGIFCGAGKGLIWCWVILALVSVLALTGTNTELAGYISQSELLTWLQNNNLLLNLIVPVQ